MSYLTTFAASVAAYAAVRLADHLLDLDGRMQALAEWLRGLLGLNLRREVTFGA